MAECHPVAFQWVVEAKKRGATVIHVDPRFTRTSAFASMHVPTRAGGDIVFLGALINHVLSGGHEFREYVTAYTNAADIVPEEFADSEQGDGLFSGYDPQTRTYDNTSWKLTGERDLTLTHPRCVFQVLKRHFERYTPEMVEQVCGIKPSDFARIAATLVAASGREKTTAWVYAVGWTQHSTGVQHIRTASILQMLLGNMGRPGGGILALRGHANIQGATDVPTLFHLLGGYMPMPGPGEGLEEYLGRMPDTGFWGNKRTYLVSMLKAWFGDAATADNDFCFDYLPRITGDHGTYRTVLDMIDKKVKGYFLLGENPAVGSAGGRLQRLALASLDWLVVKDLAMIESATFWKNSPEIESGELETKRIATEIFFLPAASHVEKDGSFTNTQRLLQWHAKALDPPGDARSDLSFIYHLGKRIRAKLAGSVNEIDRPVLDLTWDYPEEGPDADPDAAAVLAELNGYDADGVPLKTFTQLAGDGSTSCGSWIHAGCYADGVNQTARRKPWREQTYVAPEWGWAWPANRRILYNRASADPEGRPWSEAKAYVWWDADAGEWTGQDVPDIEKTKPPSFVPEPGATGPAALSGADPFILQADGKAALFVPSGLVDGPLPAHFEAGESPMRNRVYKQDGSPVSIQYQNRRPTHGQLAGHAATFPYVVTTYRLTEHHTAGAMSRTLGRLAELQPELFCEISPSLAAERGLENGGWATIVTARAAIEARVLVTRRLRPLRIPGEGVIQQVGLPYHWGSEGLVTGDSVNDLLPVVLDPNVFIQESKAATCDIRPGRRPRGPARIELVEEYRRRAGLPEEETAAALSEAGAVSDPDPGSLPEGEEPHEAGGPGAPGGTWHHDE
jgi:formate dehydrogenase major subunit